MSYFRANTITRKSREKNCYKKEINIVGCTVMHIIELDSILYIYK